MSNCTASNCDKGKLANAVECRGLGGITVLSRVGKALSDKLTSEMGPEWHEAEPRGGLTVWCSKSSANSTVLTWDMKGRSFAADGKGSK